MNSSYQERDLLNNKKTDWAVFIDRDGVISGLLETEKISFITEPEQLKLLPRVAEGISLLNKHNISSFLITNQPVIGRGLIKEHELEAIHDHMEGLLKESNAKLSKIYYCPHHPKHGIGEYKVECDCRKPKPGLILRAAEENGIVLEESYMIGDHTGDIKAGNSAGCTTILVQTGFGGDDGFDDASPDIVVEDLYAAVKFILKHKGIEQ